jgi:nicotinate phosphoribosyltransferase
VYKLGAVREPGGPWKHKVKLSEQAIKVNNPGVQQVRRYLDADGFVADLIYDEEHGVPAGSAMVDPADFTRRRRLPAAPDGTDLLVPVLRRGGVVWTPPPLAAVRQRTIDQLAALHAGVKRFLNPHQYPVGLEEGLFDLKTRLILQHRGLAA